MELVRGKNGYFYIVNGYGDIMASGEDAIAAYKNYCRKYLKEHREPITKTGGKLYYDAEHDTYFTTSMLEAEFYNDDDMTERYDWSFSAYLREITGKNGTLEEA